MPVTCAASRPKTAYHDAIRRDQARGSSRHRIDPMTLAFLLVLIAAHVAVPAAGFRALDWWRAR